jgi:exosortase A-associated hydrolase 2
MMDAPTDRPAPTHARPEVEPLFLDTPSGRLFGVHHRPAAGSPCRGHVLVAPPFNEEMNRCRSMLTLQARSLAAIGVGTLVLDLLGTGDSEGEYRDGRWPLWIDNLASGLAWLSGQRGPLRAVLGIRMGVLLAADLLRQRQDSGLALVCWQPVVDGKQHFTQFLRMRLAAQMDDPGLSRETTDSLRQQLAQGLCVEIGGYEIHPELAAAIEAAHLSRLTPPPGTPVFWLEQTAPGATEPTPASRKLLTAWSEAGVAPEVAVYQDPPFWQAHERAISPKALKLTARWLESLWIPT